MTGARKNFDRKLYEKNDTIAKECSCNLLEATKYNEIEKSKKTQVDLKVFKGDSHVFNIECEIKRVWKTKDFPYESVQFPERKKKFTDLQKPTLFVMFNADQSSYLVVLDRDLAKSPINMVRNKYIRYGENFFQVPLEKVYFNDIKSAIKEMESQYGITK